MKKQPYEPKYYEMADREDKYARFPGNAIAPFLRDTLLPGSRMLEVGCGTAGIIRELPDSVEYVGVELSEYAVEEAREEWKGRNASFEVGVSEALPFQDHSFDCVLMFYTLEHFKQPRKALLEALRVLKEDGRLVIVAPNHELPLVPETLRYKSGLYKAGFTLMRVGDYIGRTVGEDSFRVLTENMTSTHNVYEKKDDDLWHAVSTWEVVHYLQQQGMPLEKFWEEKKLSERRKGKLIGAVRAMPAMKYAAVPMVASFKRKQIEKH